MRVLIVEDDPELAGLLRDGLRAQRIDPTLASTFAEGRDRAHAGSFDVIILDVRLPGGTGFDLCGELRGGGNATPVLMLTALDGVDDRVRGLEVGADDYLTKPFAFRELVARLKALARRRLPCLRRDIGLPTSKSIWGPARCSAAAGRSPSARRSSPCWSCSCCIGAASSTAPPLPRMCGTTTMTRLPTCSRCWWGRLRRKIDDGFEPKLITTLRGAGYRFGS